VTRSLLTLAFALGLEEPLTVLIASDDPERNAKEV
jgi:hypothetical protein